MKQHDPLAPWELTNSHYAINDRFLKVRANSYKTTDGINIDPYYIIEYEDRTYCVVIDDHDNVLLVKQYRPGINAALLELPGGGTEKHDESTQHAIIRELEQELGYHGGKVFQTGVSYFYPSNFPTKTISFLAIGGSQDGTQKLDEEENFIERLVIEKMPFQGFVRQFTEVTPEARHQNTHLASVFFALNFIRASSDPALEHLKKYL